jgi:hypothetical protein
VPYRIEVSHPKFGAAKRESLLVDRSIYLGEIRVGQAATADVRT